MECNTHIQHNPTNDQFPRLAPHSERLQLSKITSITKQKAKRRNGREK